MKMFRYIIFAMGLIGCSTPVEIIKEKEIVVELPIIHEKEVDVYYTKIDTLIIFEKIVETDTLFFVKYDTIRQKLEYKIKPPKPITITIKDTIQVVDTIKVKEGDSFWENLYDYAFGIGVGLLIIVVFRIWGTIKH